MSTIIDRTKELCEELITINAKAEIDYGDIEAMDDCLGELLSLQNALASMLNITVATPTCGEPECIDNHPW